MSAVSNRSIPAIGGTYALLIGLGFLGTVTGIALRGLSSSYLAQLGGTIAFYSSVGTGGLIGLGFVVFGLAGIGKACCSDRNSHMPPK